MIPFTYFGSSQFSVDVLDTLEARGYIPSRIVTTPDKPVGRKLILTPNVVKVWAHKRNTPVIDPAKLDAEAIPSITGDIFVVASYGKIIPQAVLDIPKLKTLNVHPSLLPQYRGATPLQTAMLDDMKQTGVTIMRIDAQMDHGPIVTQRPIDITTLTPDGEWPEYEVFEKLMAIEGGKLLADVLEPWIAGTIKEVEQDHTKATFTKKIAKEDGEVPEETIRNLSSLPADKQYALFRMIQAYHAWPSVYFFMTKTGSDPSGKSSESKKIRVKITKASYKNNTLVIERVIPEGKNEVPFSSIM